MLGYQGLSPRPSCQRQSGIAANRRPDRHAEGAGKMGDGGGGGEKVSGPFIL
jgi:hypothetical protein